MERAADGARVRASDTGLAAQAGHRLTHLPRQQRYKLESRKQMVMDALAEKLDARLREWKPETAAQARERIAEVIELADHGVLDIAPSRSGEQEVLDLLDEPPTG
jgi:hypothetical protein